MEIKILDHITETQVTNIIEASGGRHILKTPGTLTLVATVGVRLLALLNLSAWKQYHLFMRSQAIFKSKYLPAC